MLHHFNTRKKKKINAYNSNIILSSLKLGRSLYSTLGFSFSDLLFKNAHQNAFAMPTK